MKIPPLILALLFFVLSGDAWAEPVRWESVKLKMTDDAGYSLFCDYSGPEGNYRFHYIVLGAGDEILTEVLEGSTRGAGTRIYYNPKLDRENVTMQTKIVRLRRSLLARDIKDSPLHQPLFTHLIGEFSESGPQAVEQRGANTVFRFGDRKSRHELLEVDSKGNPLNLRRMEAEKQLNLLTFHQLEWGPHPVEWER